MLRFITRNFKDQLLFLFLPVLLFSCREDTIEPEAFGQITGVVVETGSNNALEGVSVTTNPATSALLTGQDGSFRIEDVPVGSYAVTLKKAGYSTEVVNVLVAEGKTTNVSVVMDFGNVNNKAPNPPSNPTPADGATNQETTLTLKWRATDPNKNDSLYYSVELYESGNTGRQNLLVNSRDSTVTVEDLKFNTVYYWQVTVRDSEGAEVKGPVWSFKTRELADFRYLFIRRQGNNSDIFTGDSLTQFRLTNTSYNELQPLLSPLRDKIAFSTNELTQTHIFTMDRDGSNKRKVTAVPVAGYHNDGIGFAWSPDGSQIIYANYDKLYRINRDGSGLVLIATAPANRHFRQLDWTIIGNQIIAQTIGSNIYDSELYLMNANGTNMRPFVGNLPGRIDSPVFSLDGANVLFTRDVAGHQTATGRQLDARIFMLRTDSTSVLDLSHKKPAGTNDLFPRYSPTGGKVIFVNGDNDDVGPKRIFVMDIDGENRRLLFDPGEMPDWR
ncbi:MAG TPA: carboxypeptidase regulatory-like domain-containing protein [Adhaeribacter sp.]|nr:carboxypeptidase regulatory-like domain-containing protein [Adhaeribacter sp.]